jgi:hypothetical protein
MFPCAINKAQAAYVTISEVITESIVFQRNNAKFNLSLKTPDKAGIMQNYRLTQEILRNSPFPIISPKRPVFPIFLN